MHYAVYTIYDIVYMYYHILYCAIICADIHYVYYAFNSNISRIQYIV